MKAYSYLRFSRPEQMKGDSFRRQHKLALDYVTHNNLELDESLTFHDLGVSAFRGQNAETGHLGAFLRAVDSGLVDRGSYLLVESLDRISRDAAIDAIYLLKKICDQDITVVTLLDNMIYTRENLRSDTIPILSSLLTFMRANEESKTKSTRLKNVWINKRNNVAEKPLTSLTPAWLRLNKETQTIEVIEDRVPVIRQIFSMTLEGLGAGSIARKLNQNWIATWGRGKLWHESYVNKILVNPAVYGEHTPHKMEFDGTKKKRVPLNPISGYFPVVVSQDTFRQVQDLKAGKGIQGRKASQALRNVLSRLSRCPVCDGAMIYVKKSDRDRYLACSTAINGAGCKYRSVPYDRLESAFIAALRAGITIPVDLEKLETVEAELKKTEERMNGLIQQRTNLIDAIKQGTLTTDAVLYTDVPRTELTGKILEGASHLQRTMPYTLRDEIETLDESVAANKKIIAALRSQINLIQPAAVEQKLAVLLRVVQEKEINREHVNAALRSVCSAIIIHHELNELELKFKHTDRPLNIPCPMANGRAAKVNV